jgi:hypothetical protein
MDEYDKLRLLAINYLTARSLFINESSKYIELAGNDNLIGRIGELIALKFLNIQGRTAIKNANLVEKGYDILTSDSQKISVKLITAENKSGRTTRIKKPWTEIILITLNSNYKVERLGHITEINFNKALSDNFINNNEPYADRRMLMDNNLFDIYGKIYKNEEVNIFL